MQQARKEALEYAPRPEGQQDSSGNTHEGTVNGNEPQDHESEKGDAVQEEPTPTPPVSDDEGEDDSSGLSSGEDYFSADEEDEEDQDPRSRVLSVLELEDLLLSEAPSLSGVFIFSSSLTLSLIEFQTSLMRQGRCLQN